MNRTKLKLLIKDANKTLNRLTRFLESEDDVIIDDKSKAKIVNNIKSRGKQGFEKIKLNNFARRTMGLNPYQRDEIIDSLVENNLIKIIDDIYFVVK